MNPESESCGACGSQLPENAPLGLCPVCLMGTGVDLARRGNQLTASEGPVAAEARARDTGNLLGDYELQGEIARGGMGVVYRARQIPLDRSVAVKLLLLGKAASVEFIQRFRAEAAAAARLQHPNIVAIHEVGQIDGQHFFSMDLVRGRSLADLVRDHPLPARRAASYLKTIAEAVQYAHDNGVLHRDLKPSNILIDELDCPRITDFGIAKRLDAGGGPATTGIVLGSPSYMPPEQAIGGTERAGGGIDIYALGAVLYHLLCARPPFIGDTISEVLDQVLHREPVRLRELNPGVPADLETICLKCLDKSPERRYLSAKALAQDLDRFLHREPILARPASPPEKAWRWCQRKPAHAALVVLFLLLVSGAGLTAIRLHRMQSRLVSSLIAAADESRQQKYVADANLALQDLEEGETEQAQALLATYLPSKGEADLRGFEWRYLWGLCRGDYSLWLPTNQQIAGIVRFSPDSGHVVIYTWGSELIVRDLATREMLFHASGVTGFGGFSEDGSELLLGRGDGLLQWCAPATGKTNRSIRVEGALVAYAANARSAVVVSEEKGLSIVDTRTGDIRMAIPSFTRRKSDYGWGFPGAISPDGNILALVQSDSNPLLPDVAIQLWDTTAKSELCLLQMGRQVRSLVFSPDGEHLAVGDGDGYLLVYKVHSPTSSPIVRQAHKFPVLALAFSPDGQTLATGSSDRECIRFWNVDDGMPKTETVAGQVGDVWSLDFSPDAKRLASGTRDGPIRIWDLENHGLREIVEEHVNAREYGNVVISPDSKWIAAGCEGDCVKVWSLETLEVLNPLFTNTTYAVAFSSDSKRLLVCTSNSLPHWEDLGSPSKQPIPAYRGRVSDLCAVAFTADRRVAALGLKSGEIQVWDIELGRPIGVPLHPHLGPVRSLALSPAGDILVSGGDDKQLVVTALPSGRIIGNSFEHKGSVCAVALSPSCEFIVSGCGSQAIKLWHTTGVSTGSFESIIYHKSVIRALAISPDGLTLASGSEDRTVKLWSFSLHRQLARFKHKDHVRSVVFAPDGNTLATVTDRGTLRVFRAPSLKQVDRFLQK